MGPTWPQGRVKSRELVSERDWQREEECEKQDITDLKKRRASSCWCLEKQRTNSFLRKEHCMNLLLWQLIGLTVTNRVRAPSASTEMRAIPCHGGEVGTITSRIYHPLLLMPRQVNWRSLLFLQKYPMQLATTRSHPFSAQSLPEAPQLTLRTAWKTSCVLKSSGHIWPHFPSDCLLPLWPLLTGLQAYWLPCCSMHTGSSSPRTLALGIFSA